MNKTDFDKQVDELHLSLFKRQTEVLENPNISDSQKQKFVDILVEQSNRLEIARRIHNHYIETGEVKMPD